MDWQRQLGDRLRLADGIDLGARSIGHRRFAGQLEAGDDFRCHARARAAPRLAGKGSAERPAFSRLLNDDLIPSQPTRRLRAAA